MGGATRRRPVLRLRVDPARRVERHRRPDALATEEPLELRVGPAGGPRDSLAVTMRTPGHDLELALGYLLAEGVVSDAGDVVTARLCTRDAEEPGEYHVVHVTLAPGVTVPAAAAARQAYTSSACGVCGKTSIDAVRARSRYAVAEDSVRVPAATLAQLPDRMRQAQRVFTRTGGLHAAGLFTADGALVAVREDVGRHNAVDKLFGWALAQHRVPLRGHVLVVSGRASFELVQKAWLAGVPVLAAVSAPSTLAVELAEAAGMTLVGFLRGETMNVYAGEHRTG